MPITLDIRYESLGYHAKFAHPPFDLWGQGKQIVGAIYDGLAPYKVALGNIRLSPTVSTASEPVVTVNLGKTVLKFSFEKVEVAFSNFSQGEFRDIPNFLKHATGWLPKEFPFVSHQAVYFLHCFLPGIAIDEFLSNLNKSTVKLEGIDLGSGAVFYRAIPKKQWITKVTIDRSQHFTGGLFIGMDITVANGIVDYDLLLTDGLEYFTNALSEFGLCLPNFDVDVKE